MQLLFLFHYSSNDLLVLAKKRCPVQQAAGTEVF